MGPKQKEDLKQVYAYRYPAVIAPRILDVEPTLSGGFVRFAFMTGGPFDGGGANA